MLARLLAPWLVAGATLHLTGCAHGSGGSSSSAYPSGPALSPGPALPQIHGEWHRWALGQEPGGVSAFRPPEALHDLTCGVGNEKFWAQLDRVSVPDEALNELCLFFPAPGASPPPLQRPIRLPSGAVEGQSDDGARFLLHGNVLVVARGAAIAPLRALLIQNATPPPPLPIAPWVRGWSFHMNGLHWSDSTGDYHVYLHRSVADARRAYDLLPTVCRISQSCERERHWLSGPLLYIHDPTRR